ncbi:unnamed protein product [Closterium sp. NIES-53]
MALCPSSVPLRVSLPAPPESSLPKVPYPESDRARAVCPNVSRLLATAVTDPSFESTAASALVAELLDFAATCRLDYATALLAECASARPPSVGSECALGTDVLEDTQEDFECLAAVVPRFASMLLAPEGDPDALDILTPRSYAEAIIGPYSSQWQAAMDADMASWKSTGTYIDEVPPTGANIVYGMWIFRVKRPSGSPPAFKARYAARGFSQRQGVDYFQTFSPTPKMTTLRVLLHVAAQCDYELHSLDFSTALWRLVYGLRQVPREWHDTLRTTLAALGFAPATANPSLFLRTNTSLPPFYVLVYVDNLVFATANTEALTLVKSELQKRHTCTNVGELRSYLDLQITRDRTRRTFTLTHSHMVHQVLQHFGFQFSSPQPTPLSTSHSLSAPPSDEFVEPSGPYPELVGCLVTLGMGLVLGGRGPLVLTSHADASWVDDSATSSCEAEIYAGAMAAQELCWLTYLLTDLGERPRSPRVLYVDNKAMIALCHEHRLEHRTKHIALRYFLARELQQRGQLRLVYVATRANTADVFTKALPPACFALLDWSCDPPGYDDGSGRVWKLKRTLYGLNQSPRGWYKRIDDFLLQHGFARSECDSALYVLKEGEKQLVLLLYVEDILLFSDSKDLIREVKQRLGAEFAMRDLGQVTYYLGMHVDRDRANGTIHLHQEKYVKGVLESFGMGNSKPVGTPLATGFSCLTGEEESTIDEAGVKRFHSLAGSLMYAAVSTRPDLAYAAGVLGRVVSNPHTEHMRMGGRVLRYLQGTPNLGLVYEAGPIELKGYAYSDYAGDPSTRKSTSGYVFTLLGAAVSWQSKKQPTVALSSTEAEYMALTQGAMEAIWLRRLLAELGHPQPNPTPLFCDNQAAISLSHNAVLHRRTKHIEVKHHFIREAVEMGEVKLTYVSTKAQPADFLTKPLPKDSFRACCGRVGLNT